MAWTQDDIDQLQRAIADGRGARSMMINGQSVTFNSIPEMLTLLSVMRREVDATSTPTHRLAVVSKGT